MSKIQRTQNCKTRQRGNAAVEAALIALPFFMALIGIMNLGIGFFLNDMLHDRVRVAGRYASLHPENTAEIKNFVLYGSASAPTSISPRPSGESGSSSNNGSDVDLVPPEPFLGLVDSNISVVRTNVGTDWERINVTVSGYQIPFFIPGFVRQVVGSPVVATLSVETM